jgi:hypothetical protein
MLAEPQAPTRFTLDITFSGLCLLARRTTAKQLRVLLPHVDVHDHDGMPEHLAVIGAHKRYSRPDPFKDTGRFFEYILEGEGVLAFDPPLTQDPPEDPELALPPVVADLTTVARRRPPLAERARVRLDVDRGALCTECVLEEGTRWRFNRKEQKMATRLAWRIPNVTNKVEDSLGIRIVYTVTGKKPIDFVIRPIWELGSKGEKVYRAAFYLYHTPEDELPSHAGHPSQQAEQPGDRNEHFGEFFDLFVPEITADLPVRVPDPDDENDDDDTGNEDDEQQNVTALTTDITADSSDLGHLKELFRLDKVDKSVVAPERAFVGHHGRLFTCTLATAKDETEISLEDQDSDPVPPTTTATPMPGYSMDAQNNTAREDA